MCEVTITIAVYNVEKYIEKCLTSVLNQDFEDMEILVCDDCSKDHSTDIIRKLCEQHPRGGIVRIVRGEHNMGTAAVRNMGIDNAKGQYLLFLDGDDYIPEKAVSILYKEMQETQADFVMGNHIVFSNTDEALNRDILSTNTASNYPPDRISCRFALAEWMRRRNTDYYPVALWNKLFRKSFLQANNIRCVTSHTIIDDIYFAHQTFEKAKSVAIVKDVTMFWRHHGGSMMHKKLDEKKMNIYVAIFDKAMEDLQKLKDNNAGKIPPQLYYTLTNRYVSGFVTCHVLSTDLLTTQQKKAYINHIKSITQVGLTRNDMIGSFNKYCFTALSSKCSYHLLKLGFFVSQRSVYYFRQIFKNPKIRKSISKVLRRSK